MNDTPNGLPIEMTDDYTADLVRLKAAWKAEGGDDTAELKRRVLELTEAHQRRRPGQPLETLGATKAKEYRT